MKLTSPAFKQEGRIPSKYTCDGENINPPFLIDDVPAGTHSLVIIMDDPDVPAFVRPERMYDHWVLFNISHDITHIDEGNEPHGVHGVTTGGHLHYYGPCPPDREHRYFFKLYALDILLSLPEGSTKEAVENAMKGHIIEQTELMGVYERISK